MKSLVFQSRERHSFKRPKEKYSPKKALRSLQRSGLKLRFLAKIKINFARGPIDFPPKIRTLITLPRFTPGSTPNGGVASAQPQSRGYSLSGQSQALLHATYLLPP